jgi:hypothetical protein
MTNKETARLLRSAASALEHGRLSTFTKKLEQVNAEFNKAYVLVIVQGGIADIGKTVGNVGVDILDIDNLETTRPEDLFLSEREWEYLKAYDSDLFDYFAPSYAKRDE